MFDISTLIAFSIASLILTLVPGPNVSIIIATALNRGKPSGLAVVAGTQLGILTMMLAIAFGFEALVGFMGWAFDWIKLLGALYLIYLGFTMWRSGGELENRSANRREPLVKLVLRGFIVLWANPKTLLFFGAFIPQFVNPDMTAFPQILILGLIFLAIATITDSLYAVLAGSAGRALNKRRIRVLSRISGTILLFGGLWLATQKRI